MGHWYKRKIIEDMWLLWYKFTPNLRWWKEQTVHMLKWNLLQLSLLIFKAWHLKTEHYIHLFILLKPACGVFPKALIYKYCSSWRHLFNFYWRYKLAYIYFTIFYEMTLSAVYSTESPLYLASAFTLHKLISSVCSPRLDGTLGKPGMFLPGKHTTSPTV